MRPTVAYSRRLFLLCACANLFLVHCTGTDARGKWDPVPTTVPDAHDSSVVPYQDGGTDSRDAAVPLVQDSGSIPGDAGLFPNDAGPQSDWTSIPLTTEAQAEKGVEGGEGMQNVYDFAFASSNPNTIFFATDTAQIWKSTNGGRSWQLKNNGLRANGAMALAIDPLDEDTVFAAAGQMGAVTSGWYEKGIYKTTNGGDLWVNIRPTTQYGFPYRAVNGTLLAYGGPNRRTVYAGTHGEGLLKTTDGGESWAAAGFPGSWIYEVKVSPVDSSSLFVSTGGGLFRWVDGPSPALTQIGAGLPNPPRALAVHSRLADVLYATALTHGVYKSTNAGVNFFPINQGLPPEVLANEARNIAISPTNPERLYVTFGKCSIFYSHDGGRNWRRPANMDEQTSAGWVAGSLIGTDGDTSSSWKASPVAVHPHNENIAFLLGDGINIRKTTDGGITWRYSGSGFTGGRQGAPPYQSDAKSIVWDSADANRYVVFLADFGPFLTTNGGATFKNLRLPRETALTTWGGDLEPRPGSGLVVTAVGTWERQVLAVTRDANAHLPSWTLHHQSADGVSMQRSYHFIAFHPGNPSVIYAETFRSLDNGRTWRSIPKRVAAMFPNNGDIVYSAENSGGALRILKSTNRGSSWSTPYPDLPIGAPAGPSDIKQITVSPMDENKLFVASDKKGIYVLEQGIWSLKDDSNSGLHKGWMTEFWTALRTAIVAVDPRHPNIVYAGLNAPHLGHPRYGVFRSTDGGQQWRPIQKNLGEGFSPWSIRVSPHDGYVYIGSSHGTWKLPPPYPP